MDRASRMVELAFRLQAAQNRLRLAGRPYAWLYEAWVSWSKRVPGYRAWSLDIDYAAYVAEWNAL